MRKVKGKKVKKSKPTYARLGVFTRGVLWGMHLAGMKRQDMLGHVRKNDGTPLTLNAVDGVIKRKSEAPSWMGTDSSGGRRPKEVSDLEIKKLVALVFTMRGKARVTIPFCKKALALDLRGSGLLALALALGRGPGSGSCFRFWLCT